MHGRLVLSTGCSSGFYVVGGFVGELQSTCQGGMAIIAIQHADNSLNKSPAASKLIQPGDTLFIVTDPSNRVSLSRATQIKRPEMLSRGIQS